jgi:hypothetical protein
MALWRVRARLSVDEKRVEQQETSEHPMKIPVAINIPNAARISNYLHEDMTSDELNQDLVTVELENGYRIEAGWYLENDPSGLFYVTVSQGPSEVGRWKRQAVNEAVELVQNLAKRYSSEAVFVSRSSSLTFQLQI